MDYFVIQHCQNLKKRDFTVKTEALSRKRIGKREYLNDSDTKDSYQSVLRDYGSDSRNTGRQEADHSALPNSRKEQGRVIAVAQACCLPSVFGALRFHHLGAVGPDVPSGAR